MADSLNNGHTNGASKLQPGVSRADEVNDLLNAVQDLVIPFIRSADSNSLVSSASSSKNGQADIPVLLDHKSPSELRDLLKLHVHESGEGKDGLLSMVSTILQYSVNTWDQGFLDKLYASTNAVGVVSELLLAVLNTNVHVYQVSPALTLIEKYTSAELARVFYAGPNASTSSLPYSGGISQPGGSASNSTSIVIARNTLHPETKTDGLAGKRFVLFTSQHGHYSLEKAAQLHGFGSKAVRSVPVDEQGCMIPAELEKMISAAKDKGEVAFYVNATAGTTVLGSYDPVDALADICEKHKLWLHVDGSWGGAVAFSDKLRKDRMKGIERADSIAFNPHKMLGVPVTCSFLLGKDMRQFWKAMTLPAGYLFHSDANATPDPAEMYDLADLTPQCGRRADSLKLYLSWLYYGTSGFCTSVERAFDTASYLYELISKSHNFTPVSTFPLPCTQVCFYYAKNGEVRSEQEMDKTTKDVAHGLLKRGIMVDYAPGPKGKMIRAVINIQTKRETIEAMVSAMEEIGKEL